MFVILCLLIVIVIIGLAVQGCKLWYARPILHDDTHPESIREHMGVNDNFQLPHSKYIQSSTEKKMLLREKTQINNFHRGIAEGGGPGGYNTANALIIDPKTGLYIPNRNYNSQEFSQQGVTTRGTVNNEYTRRNRAQQDGIGGDGVGSSGSDGLDMKKMFDDLKKNLPSGGSGSGWNMGSGSSSGTGTPGTGTPGTGTPGTGTPGTGTPGTGTPDGSNPLQPGTGSPPADGSNPVSTTAGGSSSGPNTPSVTVSSGAVTNVSSNSIKKCKILLKGGIQWNDIVADKIGFKAAIFTLLRTKFGIGDPKQLQPIETTTTMTNYINDELTSTVITDLFEQGTGQNAGIIINIGMYQSININDLGAELAKISSTTEIFNKKSIGTVSLIDKCDDTKYITTATIYNKDVITIDNEVHTKDTILALIAALTSTACPRLTPKQVFTYLSNNEEWPQLQYQPGSGDPEKLRMNCGDKTLKSDGTFMATYPKTLDFTCGSNKKWIDASAKTISDYQSSKLHCDILIDTCSPILINSGTNTNTYIKNNYSTEIKNGKYSLDTYAEMECSGNFVNTATGGNSSMRKTCTVGGNFVTESGVVELDCKPKPCDFSNHVPGDNATGGLKVTATNSKGDAAQKTGNFYPHGTTLKYECSTTGYLVSNSSVQCVYGTWSDVLPQCVEEQCTETPSDIEYGTRTISTNDENKQIVKYSCDDNYILHKDVNLGGITPANANEGQTDNVKMCSRGTWTKNNTVYTCVPKPCGNLNTPNGVNEITYVDSDKHGSVATYQCKDGYQLKGQSTRTCGKDTAGTWEGDDPTCKPEGCTGLTLTNGTVRPTAVHTETVQYRCKAGYNLNGASERTCTASNWDVLTSEPRCTPGSCPTLTRPQHGSFTPTNGQAHGSVATFTCNAGYKLTDNTTNKLTCGSTTASKWSGTTPTCEVNYCSVISNQHPTNGTITQNSRTHGGTATYQCKAGYKLSSSAPKTCLNGTWQGAAPTCVACSPGTYKAETNSSTECQACGAGYYCPGTNQRRYGRQEQGSGVIQAQHIDMKDLNGKLLVDDDGSAQRKCPPGSKCPGGSMAYHRMCKLGTVQSEEGKKQCNACPNGYESYWGDLNPDGSISLSQNVNCVDKNTTHLTTVNGVKVINKAKTYNCKEPAISRTRCRACPKGTFKKSTSSVRCEACPTQKYMGALGAHGSCTSWSGHASIGWCGWEGGNWRQKYVAGDHPANEGSNGGTGCTNGACDDGYGKLRNKTYGWCGHSWGGKEGYRWGFCHKCWGH